MAISLRNCFFIISLIFAAISAESIQSDQFACKDFQCPPTQHIQCPPDSKIHITYPQINNLIEKENQNNNNIINQNDDSLIKDDNENIDEKTHNLKKRSLQYKRRESIKIVPGDYISFVPHPHHHQDKWKRDIEETEQQNITEDVHLLSKCCSHTECICAEYCRNPFCENPNELPIEKQPGLGTPGKCCPEYECSDQISCANITSTISWSTVCQSCMCTGGEKICHSTCEDDESDQYFQEHNTCFSSHLQKVFLHGSQWKDDDCTQCECVNGYSKCETSSCRPLSCIKKIKIPGECCQICVPEEEEEEKPKMMITTETSITIIPTTITTTTITPTNTTTISSSTINDVTTSTEILATTKSDAITTMSPLEIPQEITDDEQQSSTESGIVESSSTVHLCDSSISSPTVVGDAERIEKIETDQENVILYAVIVVLLILCIIFFGLFCYERTKKRTYRSVPSFDSNLNKLPLPITSPQ